MIGPSDKLLCARVQPAPDAAGVKHERKVPELFYAEFLDFLVRAALALRPSTPYAAEETPLEKVGRESEVT